MRSISAKKALITGAASGIGRAVATRLAKAGADLHLIDIDAPRLNALALRLRAYAVDVIADPANLADVEQVRAVAPRVLSRWGHLDILVNNAGIGFYGPTAMMHSEDLHRLMSVNLMAPMQLCVDLLPSLLRRPESHIVNVSSMCAFQGAPRLAAYCTSKTALLGFSESLRAEYGRHGLGVTAVCPGFVATDFFNSAVSGRADRDVPTPPRWLCTTSDRIAVKVERAIRLDRRLVLATPLSYLLYYTKRFAPGLIDLTSRVGRRRKMLEKVQRLENAAIADAAIADAA